MRRGWGFTLIEMLIVLAILATLLTIAVPAYFHSEEVARERVLVENLRVTRQAIDRFAADTGRFPESLDELQERRYIRDIPIDPILESSTAWRIISPPANKKGQVYDLKSTAPGSSSEGKAYVDL